MAANVTHPTTEMSSVREVGSAWISDSAMAKMTVEADRSAPNETGGLLLGYWRVRYSVVVITDVIGPGLRATHEPTRFIPDADYQEMELARRFRLDPERNGYLGDWHTHPRGIAQLSRQDRSTLFSIATHREARAPAPLMLVLTAQPDWVAMIWRYGPVVQTGRLYRAPSSRLNLRSYRSCEVPFWGAAGATTQSERRER